MDEPTYKFSIFVDLLLVKLYELDRVQGDSFVDLDAVRREIAGTIPAGWVFDAAKVLQARGLAQCMYNSMGVFARLTGEGRLYFEEGRGKTKEIEKEPSRYYINISGNKNQVLAGQQSGQISQTILSEQGLNPWLELAGEIEERIKNDASLTESKKEEALRYVGVAEGELKKPEPNQSILAAVLAPLSQIVSIASQVANLVKVLSG